MASLAKHAHELRAGIFHILLKRVLSLKMKGTTVHSSHPPFSLLPPAPDSRVPAEPSAHPDIQGSIEACA